MPRILYLLILAVTAGSGITSLVNAELPNAEPATPPSEETQQPTSYYPPPQVTPVVDPVPETDPVPGPVPQAVPEGKKPEVETQEKPQPVAPVEPRVKPQERSVTKVFGSGNGFGNTIIVDNDTPGNVTIRNSRNGFGNRVIVRGGGQIIDLDRQCYRGRNNNFWSHKVWDEQRETMLFWCPKTRLWYQFQEGCGCYRPVTDLALQEVNRAMQEADYYLRKYSTPPYYPE